MNTEEIRVGIGDLNIAKDPQKLITVGLGSCIGIALYDKAIGIAGLSHIMLPDSKQFSSVTNPMKFADLAIPILINKMELKGAKKRNLVAKIAGGASMFNFSDKNIISDIGYRNGIMVKEVLNELGIKLISEEIGGNKGRTMIVDSTNGLVSIRTVGEGTKEI